MSFVCAHSKEVVQGQKRELFPVVLRDVKYNYFVKSDYVNFRTGEYDLIYEATSTGVETVREVGVAEKNVEEFLKTYATSKLNGVKELNITRPPKSKFKFIKNNDDENDKGEFGV